MNQPVSSCLTHYEENLAITEALLERNKRKHADAFSDYPPVTTIPKNHQEFRGNGPQLAQMPDQLAAEDHLNTDSLGCSHGAERHPSLANPRAGLSAPPTSPFFMEMHPSGGAVISDQGKTFVDGFKMDEFAEERSAHGSPYYPFASRSEWEIASFLVRSNMSKTGINEFLGLELVSRQSIHHICCASEHLTHWDSAPKVKTMKLSFSTATDLRSRVEILPKGPAWKSKIWKTIAPTKQKTVTLFYRDPLECLQSLMHHPLMKDHIHYTPFKLFNQAKGMMRVYTEWLSGDRAWEIQVRLHNIYSVCVMD